MVMPIAQHASPNRSRASWPRFSSPSAASPVARASPRCELCAQATCEPDRRSAPRDRAAPRASPHVGIAQVPRFSAAAEHRAVVASASRPRGRSGRLQKYSSAAMRRSRLAYSARAAISTSCSTTSSSHARRCRGWRCSRRRGLVAEVLEARVAFAGPPRRRRIDLFEIFHHRAGSAGGCRDPSHRCPTARAASPGGSLRAAAEKAHDLGFRHIQRGKRVKSPSASRPRGRWRAAADPPVARRHPASRLHRDDGEAALLDERAGEVGADRRTPGCRGSLRRSSTTDAAGSITSSRAPRPLRSGGRRAARTTLDESAPASRAPLGRGARLGAWRAAGALLRPWSREKSSYHSRPPRMVPASRTDDSIGHLPQRLARLPARPGPRPRHAAGPSRAPRARPPASWSRWPARHR